jgi:hypothetical protein
VARWWKTVELLTQAISLNVAPVVYLSSLPIPSRAGDVKCCVPVCFAILYSVLNLHLLGSGNFKYYGTAFSLSELQANLSDRAAGAQ